MKTARDELSILKVKGRSGSSVKTAVIKATRNESAPPKRKHVEYLILSTRGGKPNTHALLTALQERTARKDWKIVIKTLYLVHRLLRDADPSFATACSRTSICVVTDFADIKDDGAFANSTWIRIYGRYLEHKIKIIRKFHVQFELIPDKVLDYDYATLFPALKYMLIQLAYILEFEPKMDVLNHPLSQTALQTFAIILKDSVNLYVSLLQGFVRVLEEYRDMCKSEVETAADLYDRFVELSELLIKRMYPKCQRYTKQLPKFDVPSAAPLKELDAFARDEAPLEAPVGRKARARDGKKKTGSVLRGRGDDGDDYRRGERKRQPRQRESGHRRDSLDVSFEDIPKTWQEEQKSPRYSAGGKSPRYSTGRKEKDEYSDEGVSRSEDEDRQGAFDGFNVSSEPLPSSFFQQQQQHPQQHYQQQQQRVLPQQQQQQARHAAPMAENFADFGGGGGGFPQQQQQPPPRHQHQQQQQFSPSGAASFNPFGDSGAQPVSQSFDPFGPSNTASYSSGAVDPYLLDPFSPSAVAPSSNNNNLPIFKSPEQSLDPSLPPVIKTIDYGPNVLDDSAFNPFAAVNL